MAYKMLLKPMEIQAFCLGTHGHLFLGTDGRLLGLYGSCSWRTHSSLLLDLYGSFYWVSMALKCF